MTVASTTNRVAYTGDGVTDEFAYTFRILDQSHLQVDVVDTTDGSVTTKTITTDYTVSDVGAASGGNVQFAAGNIPSATEKVILKRNIPVKQETDYIENDTFPAQTHEDALDKLTMIIQQLKEEIDRALKVPDNDVISDAEIVTADLTAEYVFRVNTAGTGIEAEAVGQILDDTVGDLTALSGGVDSANDLLLIYDNSSSTFKKVSVSNVAAVLAAANTVSGGEGIDVTQVGDDITIAGEDASDTNKGIATFDATDFTVTAGDVTINSERIQDLAGAMWAGNTETGATVTYQDADGTIDITVSDLTVAGDSGSTGMTPGDTLTIAGGTNATTAMSGDTLTVNVDDAFLSNSGDTGTGSYTITGDLAVDNININGNTIISTDTNGNITLDPNGTGNVALGNYTLDGDQTVGAGQDNYVLTYDNGTGLISLEASAGGSSLPVTDTTSIVEDPVDATKEMRIDVGAVSTSTVRVLTMPDQDVDLTPDTGTFAAAGAGGAWELITTATASASASITFTDLSSTYFMYVVIIDNLLPVTDDVEFQLRTSANNGCTYDGGASDYVWSVIGYSGSTGTTSSIDGDDADTSMVLTGTGTTTVALGNATDEEATLVVEIWNPSRTDDTRVNWRGCWHDDSGNDEVMAFGFGRRNSAAAVDAIQFAMSSGNISTGTFKLYGIKAS
jgi:hypothetical protein